MKISKVEDRTIDFGELKPGDVFTDNDIVYCIKISDCHDYYRSESDVNAIDVGDGCFYFFSNDKKVKKVECELLIK